MAAPIVDGLEKEFQGRVAVQRIDANADPRAREFGINAVPTFIFLDSTGKEIERQEGFNAQQLRAGFEKAAASGQ